MIGIRRQPVTEAEPELNLTPLIDVVFVILIMFIVIAPLMEYENIQLAEASIADLSQAKSVAASSVISIHVKADNTISLNGECVGCENLTVKLQEMKQQHPEITPQLFQDKRAQFGTYQKVKNATEAAGYASLDLILSPP
jgi:biopolymer transport protein ExbD